MFLEKPPLKFWIVAAPIRAGLLPHDEFGLRFWDAVFGLCDSIEFKERELYVNGNQAALVFTILQHRKDGTTVKLDGVDVFEIDGSGKLKSTVTRRVEGTGLILRCDR